MLGTLVRSHGVVDELDHYFVAFIDCCGTVLALLDVLHKLPKVRIALPGAADCNVLCLCVAESHYLLLFESLIYHSTVENDHFSRLRSYSGRVGRPV
jgi:hypothetical protein